MADDVLDIIHRISFNVDDDNLDRLTVQLRRQTETINNLGQRQARLAQAYDRTSAHEIERRRRIAALMERNNHLLQQNSRGLENNVLNNRQLNEQLTRELGLIGAINTRLDLLHQRRRQATSESEVRRYSGIITREQSRLDDLNRVPRNRAAGFLGNLGQLGGAGTAISSLIPQVAGALSIASLGNQIFEVTKRFEGYTQTLKNAYGSSVKAQGAFDKIQQFAAKTPFGVDELTASFIKLKNRGFDPTTAELTKMGDFTASQGKSMDQYVEALLDAQTGEYERLKEFGIKAKTTGDMVTFTFRGISKTVSKFSEVDIRNAILGFGELKGVAGGMAGQAQTLNGKMSNLGDTMDMIFSTIGNSNKGVMTDLIGLMGDLAESFLDVIKNSPAQELRNQQYEVNALVTGIASLNQGEEVRSLMISELTLKYPELIKGIDLESASSAQLLGILDGINSGYERRIKLAERTSFAEVAAEKSKKAFAKTSEIISDLELQKALEKTSKLTGINYAKQFNEAQSVVDKANVLYAAQKESLKFKNNGTMPMVGWRSFNNVANNLLEYDDEAKGQLKLQIMGEGNRKKAEFEDKKRYDFLKKREKDRLKFIKEQEILEKQNKLGDQAYHLTRSRKEQGEYLSLAIEFEKEINLDSTKVNSQLTKKDSPKKTSYESPQEKELKRLAELEKIEQEKEKDRNAQFLINQNSFLNKKEISQTVYDARMQKNAELHESKMLNITIKYAKSKVPFQKGADKVESTTAVTESTSKLSEIERKVRERSEAEIKAAVEIFNELTDEVFQLQKDSDEKELDQMRKHHKAKLNEIDKQTEEERQKLITAQESKNQNLEVVVLSNIKTLEEKKKATTESFSEQERKTLVSQFNKKIDKQTELQIDALEAWSEAEKRDFILKKESAENRNAKEIEILKKNNQNKQELQERTYLASLYLQLKGENEKMTNLISMGKATEDEIRKQQKSIDNISKQITDKQANVNKSADNAVFGWGKNNIKNAKENLKQALKAGEITQAEYDEQITKLNAKRIAGYAQTATEIAQTAQTVISAFEQQADREIEIRQRRVDQTREIADRGNAEALQEEERRLDKAVKTRQKFAKQQMAINLLMQASAIALAIAEAAAASGGIGAPVGIAIVLAALATGFAAVKGFTQDTPAFKDGVIGFNGKGTGTSDSNLVRISNGESVITASATQKNREILEQINAGNVFKPLEFNPGKILPMPSSANSYDFTRLENKIESLKSDIKSAIADRAPNTVSIDRRGFIAMTEEVQSINRKRDKL